MDACKRNRGWYQEARCPQWAELKKTIKGYKSSFWIFIWKKKFAIGLGKLVQGSSVVNIGQGGKKKKEEKPLLFCFFKILHLHTPLQFTYFYLPTSLLGRYKPSVIEEDSQWGAHLPSTSGAPPLFYSGGWETMAKSGCETRELKPRTREAIRQLPPVPFSPGQLIGLLSQAQMLYALG